MNAKEQIAVIEAAQLEITKIHPLFASLKVVVERGIRGIYLVQDEQGNWAMHVDPEILDVFPGNAFVHILHDVYHLYEETLDAMDILPPDTNITRH